MTAPIIIAETFEIINVDQTVTTETFTVEVFNVPGQKGATGDAGPPGPPGADGAVASVTAGDGTITIGGTTANPTVKAHTGTAAGTVAAGNDSRLSDARTPTAHAATHGSGGTDAVTLSAAQITAGILATARLGTGTADATKFLRGDGSWATPSNAPKAVALDPGNVAQGQVAAAANVTFYVRILTPGSWSVSAIGFVVGVAAGNVQVGALRDNGSNAPGVLVAASASVACPSAGGASVALGSTITVNGGDWLAISFSSASATVWAQNANSGNVPTWRACKSTTAPGSMASNPTVAADNVLVPALWGN